MFGLAALLCDEGVRGQGTLTYLQLLILINRTVIAFPLPNATAEHMIPG